MLTLHVLCWRNSTSDWSPWNTNHSCCSGAYLVYLFIVFLYFFHVESEFWWDSEVKPSMLTIALLCLLLLPRTSVLYRGFGFCLFFSSFFISLGSSINLKLIHDRVVMAHQQNETFAIKIGEFSSTASAKYIKHQSRKEKSTPKHGPIVEA